MSIAARIPTGRFLWRLMRFRPGAFAGVSAVWLVIFAGGLGTGLALRGVFDALSGDAPAGLSVWTLIALIVVIETTGRLISYANVVLENSLAFNVNALLRTNMLERLLERPGADHLPEPTGELVNRFRDDVGEIMSSIWWPAVFVGQAVFAAVAVTIMVQIHALMTLVMLLPLALVVVGAQLATARMQHYRRESRGATGDVTGFLGEVFGAVQAIQVAGAERHVRAHFDSLSEHRRRDAVRDRVFNQLVDALWWNSSSLSIGAMLLVAAGAMRSGDFTVGEFALFAYYLEWLRSIPMAIGTLIARYRHAAVAFERLARVVEPAPPASLVADRTVYLGSDPPEPAPLPERDAPLERLEARGLTYRHSSGRGVSDVDLTLERGSLTVVTGQMGAGKTTLLRTLLGLLERDAGEVRWNGERAEDPASFLLPPRAAYVPQAPRLFSTTIRDNILLGLREDDVDLEGALRAAVLEPDLAALDDGLDTVVGPRGVRLSGGQVQRVAAARMFVRDADLLVLDDLSSALDVETEALLWERVRERADATILAVSHRRAVLAAADRIVVLHDGRVAGSGTLEELLASSPEMRALWERET